MSSKNLIQDKLQGSEKISTVISTISTLLIITIGLFLFKYTGLIAGFALLGIPIGLFALSLIWHKPKYGVWSTIILAFFTAGISRYIPGKWALLIDILLALSWLVVLLNNRIEFNWKNARHDIVFITIIWFGYLVLQISNPNGNGIIAWLYAMRSIGFYQFLTIPLIFLLFREEKDLENFIKLIIWLSLLGTIWGFKQQLFGVDSAEYYWLYVEEHHEEHILFGVLRVFSFYSDAGAFGASQAMMSLMCTILFLGPFKTKQKFQYLIFAIIFFLGFSISGTRGALAVPFGGGIAYLILSKNFKILLGGAGAMIIVFVILKYTFLLQGVEQVRRMRSALNPENASLNVRFENQKTFARYIADKPFGSGVGTAGYWGKRFNPNSLMANTPTDSWYAKIWVETGLIGLTLHIAILGYILGYLGYKITRLRNPRNHSYSMALYAMFAGALLASYGNQVLIQMPTGILVNFILPFIVLIEVRDKKEYLEVSKVDDKLID